MKRYSLILLLLAAVLQITAQTYNNTYTPQRRHQTGSLQTNGERQYTIGNSRQNGQYGNQYTLSPYNRGLGSGGSQGTYKNAGSEFGYQSAAPMQGFGSRYHSTITPPGATSVGSQSGPRRVIGGGDEDDGEGGESGKPGNQDDPYATPVGNVPFALMLLLALMFAATNMIRRTEKMI